MHFFRTLFLIVFCLFVAAFDQTQVHGQVFLADDPIWDDPDQLNIPAPAESQHSEYYDFYENTFHSPEKANKGPAQNVNSLGEVPNSSWYTNRHYMHRMSIQDLLRGPDQGEGPSMEGTWEIVKGKSQGITPGFTIKDADGGFYLIKFDPPDNPEMTTAAEIISTKFFYALGYNVPENYLLRFNQDRLVLSPTATTRDALGKKKPLTARTVVEMLNKAHKDKQGLHRAIASKLLSRKPLGPFLYIGTRPDDANDIFPHEARRELRGLRLFCAWLNHDDSRAINTLDMFVNNGGRQFVKHYLIDFGSTLGSGSVAAQALRAGNEYIIESKPIFRGLFSFGLWIRPWAKFFYSDYPSIGRIEGDFFDPEKWKTEYPNPAFLNCDAEDAFWAAKQVMNFTDVEIRAIVSSGKFSNPEAENYLAATIIKRRDKIGKRYLHFSGGLDKFQIVDGNKLIFKDLLAKHKLGEPGVKRKITWYEFNNNMNNFSKLLTETESENLQISIPSSDTEFIAAAIVTPGPGTTEVFLRNYSDRWEVVGIRRE